MAEAPPEEVYRAQLDRIYRLSLKYGDVSAAVRDLLDMAYYATMTKTEDPYIKVFEAVLRDIVDMFPARKHRVALAIDKAADKALNGPEAQYVGDVMMEVIAKKYEIVPPRAYGTEERLKRVLEELKKGG